MNAPTPNPYARKEISAEEHGWYQDLAEHVAARSAEAMAKGDMRLGVAHKYLIAAHIMALVEGSHEDAAEAFLSGLARDLGLVLNG